MPDTATDRQERYRRGIIAPPREPALRNSHMGRQASEGDHEPAGLPGQVGVQSFLSRPHQKLLHGDLGWEKPPAAPPLRLRGRRVRTSEESGLQGLPPYTPRQDDVAGPAEATGRRCSADARRIHPEQGPGLRHDHSRIPGLGQRVGHQYVRPNSGVSRQPESARLFGCSGSRTQQVRRSIGGTAPPRSAVSPQCLQERSQACSAARGRPERPANDMPQVLDRQDLRRPAPQALLSASAVTSVSDRPI